MDDICLELVLNNIQSESHLTQTWFARLHIHRGRGGVQDGAGAGALHRTNMTKSTRVTKLTRKIGIMITP